MAHHSTKVVGSIPGVVLCGVAMFSLTLLGSLYGLHVFAGFSFIFSSFFTWSENMHMRLTGKSKLALDGNVSVNGCLPFYVFGSPPLSLSMVLKHPVLRIFAHFREIKG